MYEFNLKIKSLCNYRPLFCHPNFVTNKIFVFLNACIDCSKKIAATGTTLI